MPKARAMRTIPPQLGIRLSTSNVRPRNLSAIDPHKSSPYYPLMLSVTRRNFLAGLTGLSLRSHLWSKDDRSDTLRRLQLGGPIPIANSHGDTWAPAWASDGNL